MTTPDSWKEISLDEERAALRAVECEPSNGVKCHGKLHIAIFFDGIGLNIADPALPPSNVGRLFRGFGTRAVGSIARNAYYVSGLGTDMNLSAYEFPKDQAGAIAGDMLKSVTVDPAKDLPVDTAKDIGLDILKGKRIGPAVSDAIKGLPGKVRKDVGEAIRNPGKTGVKVVKDAAGNIARAILDQFDPVRDSKFMFEAINSGAAPRISQGVKHFKTALASTSIKIEEIQVSVFGCDWGAALARAFLNELCKECDGDENSDKLEWELADKRKVPLKLVFAGFYDAVGYRDNSFVGFAASKIPWAFGILRNTAADAQDLPRALAKAAHFISAHELRWRVHTLGGAQLVPLMASPMAPPARQERIYPGLGRDVSGSYPKGFQQRDSGIGHVALQEMWRIARLSGVPFEGLEQTRTNARDLGADFDIVATSRARDVLRNYQQQLGPPSAALLEVRHAEEAIDGMEGDKTLARQIYLHRMVYVVWLVDLLAQARRGAAPGYLYISAMQAAIDFARLEIMHKHAGKETFYGRAPIAPPTDYQRACMEVASLQRLPRLGPSTIQVFSTYMHDPVDPPDDDWAIQRLPSNARLFRSRFIDDGDDTRQPTFTEKLKKAADDTFSNMTTPNSLILGLPF
jgi:hypothetical protein